MILHVTGVETVEVTDPQGVCNQAQPSQGIPIGQQPYTPQPMSPTPFGPTITPLNPLQIPTTDPGWRNKWQPGFTGDPPGAVFPTGSGDKWTKNMQLRNAGEDLKAGQPGTEQRNEI